MLRASVVGGDLRAVVGHVTLDQRHLVLSGVVDVSGHLDAVSGLAADQAVQILHFVIRLLLVEVLFGHGHKLGSVSGSADLLAVLGCGLEGTGTQSG
jgi:hypothetical protein